MFNLNRFLDPEYLISLLYMIPIYLITLTVHEVSHGYIAYKMGDPTAYNMGRLTLNPLKHIDPFGLLMLIIIRFGWAKPVPINPRNFKNPRKGLAISAAAGPVSNFLMAIGGYIIFRIFYVILMHQIYTLQITEANSFINILNGFCTFFNQFCILNIYFGLFNLLPVPPLDGSRIVSYFLPYKFYRVYSNIERYGFLILMLLLYTGVISKPLSILAGYIYKGIEFIVCLIPFFKGY